MNEFNIEIQSNSSVRLPVAGKYCDRDIIITAKGEGVAADPYEGDYSVTPSLEEQTLPTNQKFMNADITIKKIPITTVSNSSGGNTVIIGG